MSDDVDTLRKQIQEQQDREFELREELRGWERIGELYSLMRGELAEKEAWVLHGGFQAAACGKDIEECRRIASHRLRVPCAACDQSSTVVVNNVRDAAGRQNLATCKDCGGSGFIQLPALQWMKNGNVQFRLLPKDHPDYDPTP